MASSFDNRAKTIGRVLWFDPNRGFGFIRPFAGDGDVFVHISAVRAAGVSDELTAGERLAFHVDVDRRGGRGPRAVRLSWPPA